MIIAKEKKSCRLLKLIKVRKELTRVMKVLFLPLYILSNK